jgi:RimJ/RimL family protein N-acetyltransferase
LALSHSHQTARLRLRPVVATDEAAVVSGIDDIAVSGWLAVVPHPYTTADFQHFCKDIAAPGETFVIEDTIGFAGIISIVEGVLGYWLLPRAQGLGYATEAGRCLVAAHFASSDEALTSGYFDGNLRSANVLAKLGFVETGRDRKHCVAQAADLPHVNVRLTREGFAASV